MKGNIKDEYPSFIKEIWKLHLSPCVISMPVVVEAHTVPHFKAPTYGKIDLWGPECGGTFILDYTLANIGHLQDNCVLSRLFLQAVQCNSAALRMSTFFISWVSMTSN